MESLKLLSWIFLLFFINNTRAQSPADNITELLNVWDEDTSKVNKLNALAEEVYRSDPELAVWYGSEAKLLAEELNYTRGLALAYKNTGLGYYMQGDYWETLRNWEVSLNFYQDIDDKQMQSNLLSNIGAVYFTIGENMGAIDYYQPALKIAEEIRDSLKVGTLLLNIGTVYSGQTGTYDSALNYFIRAIEFGESIRDISIMGTGAMNLGEIYMEKEEYDSALYYFEKSLMLTDDPVNIARTLNFMGAIYAEKGEYKSALTYYRDALEMANRENMQLVKVKVLLGRADTYERMGNMNTAIEYFKESEVLAEKIGVPQELAEAYEGLVSSYARLSDYQNAFQYQEKLISIKDTLYQADEEKMIRDREFKLGLLIKDKELVIADLEHNAVIEQLTIKRQKISLLGVIASIVVILIFTGLLLHRYRYIKRVNKKISAQRDEIEAQRDKIEKQRDEIELQRDEVGSQRDLLVRQKGEIIDSINYAKRIQSALMLPEPYLNEVLGEAFIFYLPRDIVSGDFYWIREVGHSIVLAAADCTGHGVPGALLSMLGISYLNEIVQVRENIQANEVLNELRTQIKLSLRQNGQPDESRDGIDMALCIIDKKNRTLQYAGANNPLYLIRNEQDKPNLREVKPDRMPLGYYQNEDRSFTNHRIPLEPGDRIYVFSDGYMDQKGGPEDKKFMSRNFKDLLLKIHDKPMYDQKEILEHTYAHWKGDNTQIDDVLVMGFKV